MLGPVLDRVKKIHHFLLQGGKIYIFVSWTGSAVSLSRPDPLPKFLLSTPSRPPSRALVVFWLFHGVHRCDALQFKISKSQKKVLKKMTRFLTVPESGKHSNPWEVGECL